MADMRPPTHFPPDEAGAFQRLDMFGGRSQRHLERLGELTYGALALAQLPEHMTAGAISQGMEDSVETGRFLFNHVVEYGDRNSIVN